MVNVHTSLSSPQEGALKWWWAFLSIFFLPSICRYRRVLRISDLFVYCISYCIYLLRNTKLTWHFSLFSIVSLSSPLGTWKSCSVLNFKKIAKNCDSPACPVWLLYLLHPLHASGPWPLTYSNLLFAFFLSLRPSATRTALPLPLGHAFNLRYDHGTWFEKRKYFADIIKSPSNCWCRTNLARAISIIFHFLISSKYPILCGVYFSSPRRTPPRHRIIPSHVK